MCDAETTSKVLIDKWISIFGLPKYIQSDNGSRFTAMVFEKTCEMMGIEHIKSSLYHPQSQGQIERQNQLVDNLRCVVREDIAGWGRAIPVIQYAHNTSKTLQRIFVQLN